MAKNPRNGFSLQFQLRSSEESKKTHPEPSHLCHTTRKIIRLQKGNMSVPLLPVLISQKGWKIIMRANVRPRSHLPSSNWVYFANNGLHEIRLDDRYSSRPVRVGARHTWHGSYFHIRLPVTPRSGSDSAFSTRNSGLGVRSLDLHIPAQNRLLSLFLDP
jgi:hypothetical protein